MEARWTSKLISAKVNAAVAENVTRPADSTFFANHRIPYTSSVGAYHHITMKGWFTYDYLS